MEDQLQHDPRTKKQIKDTLYAYLYAPIQKQFKFRLDSLIMKNSVILGSSHNSFMYRGVLYSCDTGRVLRKLNRLVPQLHAAMDEYLKELKQLNDKELPFVIGFINQVLNSSNDPHDYLRVFPSSIHRPIEDIIASCPCRTKNLTDFDVECLQKKNQSSIDMIKQRMVINLIS